MISPYLSVILPVYNVEAYLDRCVRSILDQDYSDYELILVDDGSTDRSGQLCDQYASQYPQIQVVHKTNGGLSSARNAGMEQATGQYIWWVDSDDWIRDDALTVLHRLLTQQEPDILKFHYIRAAEEQTEVRSCAEPGSYRSDSQRQKLLKQALTKTSKYLLSAWSHVYKRSFLEENELRFVSEREIGSEDYLFNLQGLLCAKHIYVLPEALYFYELRQGSLTQRYRKDCFPRYTQLYLRLKESTVREDCLPLVHTFYVWHLIHGICIPNAYCTASGHTVAEGRRELQSYLKTPELQLAIKRMDRSTLTGKQRLQLLAMKLRYEPVFYRLYVVKPGRKKGTENES